MLLKKALNKDQSKSINLPMPQFSIKPTLDLLRIELNTIDPTISKTYDNTILLSGTSRWNHSSFK